VQRLIAEQFPQWSSLPVRPVVLAAGDASDSPADRDLETGFGLLIRRLRRRDALIDGNAGQ
jgi:hypothetical protein